MERNSLLVQKLWSTFLKKRMEKEMEKYKPIELAFQEIRAKTGNTDVRLLVEKFMNKEQTYGQLLVAIKAYEQKYDDLKKLNEEKQDKVNELKIANENRRIIERPAPDNEKETDKFEKKIDGLETTNEDPEQTRERNFAIGTKIVQQLEAEEQSLNNRKKNMMLITNQLNGWMTRVAAKMADQQNDL